MAAKQPRPQASFVSRFHINLPPNPYRYVEPSGKFCIPIPSAREKGAAIFPVLATEPNATPTARPLRDIMDHDSEKEQPILIPTCF